MRGFLLDLRDGAMAAAPEDSERRAARDVASWRLEQQEEGVVLGLIGTETGITALVRLAGDGAQPPEPRRTALEALELKASECHDSERYSLLERIEAFLEEQLRADALDLLVVGQAGWAEHDHRLPLLQGAARGMQLAASEVLPLFGSGAGRKLPMLTLRAEEEAGDLRIRTRCCRCRCGSCRCRVANSWSWWWCPRGRAPSARRRKKPAVMSTRLAAQPAKCATNSHSAIKLQHGAGWCIWMR